jgi:hypothetical protein
MLRRSLILFATTLALLTSSAVAFGAIPAHPRWKSSALDGIWNHGGYEFQNDMWNCPQAACGAQTIWADGASDWGVQSTMASGNTAVLTYPDIGKVFSGQPVSDYTLIRDKFRESMPSGVKGLSAEAADDVWLSDYKYEMMIWVDNIGRSLAGGQRIGKAVIGGQHFTVWKFGSSEFIFDLTRNESSGVTNILASIDWLTSHKVIPSNVTLTQAEFGWEIASTGGSAASFKVSKFWLHASTK